MALGRHDGNMQSSDAAVAARHPRDPDPVPSTKAFTAFVLSIVAVVLAPFFGGVLPALIVLRLSAQAQTDIEASEGFLLGAARCRKARRLAWIALAITAAVVVALILWRMYAMLGQGPALYEIDPDVN